MVTKYTRYGYGYSNPEVKLLNLALWNVTGRNVFRNGASILLPEHFPAFHVSHAFYRHNSCAATLNVDHHIAAFG
jgi:hypothetical protein